MKNCGFSFETSYLNLPEQFYTKLRTDIVDSPEMVILNHTLAETMGLDFSELTDSEKSELFSGNKLPVGSIPFAQAYAGHQFGYFSILGDGRAHLLGEHITAGGLRLDIQFKGSGRTPYSRGGDGKAALGPMLREYIISEALYHLDVPTTRSLAVVKTGEQVIRQSVLSGAILTRVASSHLRVGTFEYAANQLDKKALELLMNYTIERHYPEILENTNKALSLIKAVMEKQAELIVHWMRVGFIHGVMNTDNMTVTGETIDYGPCAFMDRYDPMTVFSSIDRMGRYAYANQANIAQWNLARFAETLLQFIDNDLNKAANLAEETINQFSEIYSRKWISMMKTKLGLFGSYSEDQQLVIDLLDWMKKSKADYTNTFFLLSQLEMPNGKHYEQNEFKEWYLRWYKRLNKNTKSLKESYRLMRTVNPVVIPRNHNVESVLEAANTNDFKPFVDFLAVLKKPYIDRPSIKPFQSLPIPSNKIYQTFCGT